MNNYAENLKPKIFFYIFSFLLLISLSSCNGCDNGSNPTGPSEGTPYAIQVVSSDIICQGINLYTNPGEALGAPNWSYKPDGSYSGFVSLGPNGYIVLKMGVDVIDGPGSDIRIYQAVSNEETAVYVTDNLSSPFAFLGSTPCAPFCDFDLSVSGYSRVRYIMIEDRELLSFCHESVGTDIDAVEAINYK